MRLINHVACGKPRTNFHSPHEHPQAQGGVPFLVGWAGPVQCGRLGLALALTGAQDLELQHGLMGQTVLSAEIFSALRKEMTQRIKWQSMGGLRKRKVHGLGPYR